MKIEKAIENFRNFIKDENLGGDIYSGVLKFLQIIYDAKEQKDFKIEFEQFSRMQFQMYPFK